jgi:hypothetical protein
MRKVLRTALNSLCVMHSVHSCASGPDAPVALVYYTLSMNVSTSWKCAEKDLYMMLSFLSLLLRKTASCVAGASATAAGSMYVYTIQDLY